MKILRAPCPEPRNMFQWMCPQYHKKKKKKKKPCVEFIAVNKMVEVRTCSGILGAVMHAHTA